MSRRKQQRRVIETDDIEFVREQIIKEDIQKRSKRVEAKSPGQQKYLDTIREKSIILVCGPPGSGKTILSASVALEYLREGKVKKIYISRPLVQACGEKMGELPGDMNEKIEPYLIPIFEALEFCSSKNEVKQLIESGKLEIVPCGFLRGRSLHDAFIIIEESQNLTFDQIKLILTRIGQSSTLILGGDLKQSDLGRYQSGGFLSYFEILKDLPFVGICKLGKADIFRSPYIASIIEKIEEYEERENKPVKGW